MTREEVQQEARKWLGVPFRKRGRSEDGVDCIGFIVVVGRAFSIPHQDESDYSLWPAQDHLILRKLGQYLVRLSPDTSLPGTVGVFAERRLPGHVGIFSEKYGGAVHLIHARISPGRVIEEPWQHVPYHELRLIGLFGFPGLEL
jgi:cell wall-associated NlpC family hydrolase